MKQHFFFFFFASTFNLFYYVPSLSATPIIGGLIVDQHTFKHHVSLHKIKLGTYQYEYFCGGSIINERYALTAAHCFVVTYLRRVITNPFDFSQNKPKIIAGCNQRDGPGIETDIVKIFIPKVYHYLPDRYADIAVVQLRDNLDVLHSDTIESVPMGMMPPDYYEVNKRATFCGYGLYQLPNRDHPTPITMSEINRFLTIRMLDDNECPDFGSRICGRNADPTVFRTACYGDSGAGLIFTEHGLVGVLSSGPPRCNTDTPIRFTRVSAFRNYIDRAMDERGNHADMHVYVRDM